MIKNPKVNIIIWQIAAVIGLNLAYTLVIAKKFSYMGFQYEFDSGKVILSTLFMFFLLLLGIKIKDEFINAVWNIMFLYLFCGEMIFYQYNPNSRLTQPLLISICLIMIYFLSKIKVAFKERPPINKADTILTVLCFLMFTPFVVLYYKYIDFNNLFLNDVYDTRALFRTVSIPLTGYLLAPLVRILLPMLIIKNLEGKKYVKVLLFLSMILFVYLCGALKSVFFGLLALLFFYKGDILYKCIRFCQAIALLTFSGLIVALSFDNVFLLDSFIRRVFFVPPYLNNIYINFFENNYTYLSHSPLGIGLANNSLDRELSMYVGEVVMGLSGLNANVGVITEGFVSFGFFGGVFFSLTVALLIIYFKMIRLDSKYFGILFVYIYYLNTAFTSILLLTHGLFFFIIFSYFFLRSTSKVPLQKLNT